MRRIALKALAGLYGSAALLLGSCIGYVLPDNCGFPQNVFLSANGDTKSIRGAGLYGISIGSDAGGNGCGRDTLEGRYELVRREWLTVKYDWRTGEMDITAEPNRHGQSRRLTIGGMVMDSSVSIEVYQGKQKGK